ncbi:hypothetical protein TorRG33x02_227530 [Trema orientale]|uniref:Uncharacterized protein n=1 Tax=Trema orientale TaxID=63057 RepID=A0A2P5E7H0_TREOI|nr:hypothetical protein TorRG33x02_227530 [Trema orientale]
MEDLAQAPQHYRASRHILIVEKRILGFGLRIGRVTDQALDCRLILRVGQARTTRDGSLWLPLDIALLRLGTWLVNLSYPIDCMAGINPSRGLIKIPFLPYSLLYLNYLQPLSLEVSKLLRTFRLFCSPTSRFLAHLLHLNPGGNSGGIRARAVSSTTSTSSGTARDLYLSDGEELEVMVTWVRQWVPINRDPPEAESGHDALNGSSHSPNVYYRSGAEPGGDVEEASTSSCADMNDAFLVDSDNEFGADDMASMATPKTLNKNCRDYIIPSCIKIRVLWEGECLSNPPEGG